MDSNNSPSIMTAIVLGVPLTHHAPLLIDSTCMVAQASTAAPAPLAPITPPPPTPSVVPASPLHLPSPTPGSFTLAVGPRDSPASYAFHQDGQIMANSNITDSSVVAAPAAFLVATPVGLAPATPPSIGSTVFTAGPRLKS
ncbi:hypothetical protein SORBI_3003G145050 [Sorghum bicolor]|uniref:Uncharacterized protein n=1 Tax=Sorghum bicolor TaxID=4558 RepID=A0A1W0VXE8_SORBI|nr:hypothetical protein SORBI_3003G145050 [Sorghum bicolor]